MTGFAANVDNPTLPHIGDNGQQLVTHDADDWESRNG